MANLRRFLLFFAQENVEFRYPEIKSLIKFFNLDIKLPNAGEKPYWIIENASESDLKKIASRSVSLRYVVEIWGSGTSYGKFHETLRSSVASINPQFMSAESSFRITVETYNKHFKHEEKIEKIESVDYVPFNGRIELKNPENNFIYFEFWGMDPMKVPEQPEEIVFGRWLFDGQRDLVKSISLKTRKFIGNTSMNPLLSLLMANQALCDKNQLMLDPFVGTGSLLVAAAKFGSFVMGSDIDYLMLHGKTKPSRVRQKVRAKDESIKSNFIQYNLQHLYLDVLVADFSNCPFTDAIRFDSIITDPPYGIREKMEQVVPKEGKKSTVLAEDAFHYPSTSSYSIKGIYVDLLTFSAKHLKLGGRLVCWFPVVRADYNEKLLPQHSAFELVANSEQKLNGEATRRLLTYEKVQESGELLSAAGLEEIDFRSKYFTQLEKSSYEKRVEKHQRNIIEARKRGKEIDPNFEMKNNASKKSSKKALREIHEDPK